MKKPTFVMPSKSAIAIDSLLHRTFIMNSVESDQFINEFNSRLADRTVLENWLFNDVLAPKLVEQEIDARGAKEGWDTMRDLPVPTFVNSVLNGRLEVDNFRKEIATIREARREQNEKLARQTQIIADCFREEIPSRAEELNKILSGEAPAHHAIRLQFGIPSDKITLAQAMIHLIMVGKKGIDFAGFNSVNPYAAEENGEQDEQFGEEL